MFRKLSSNALWIWLAPLVGIPLLLALPLFLNGEVLVFRDLASFIIPAQSYGASILAQGKLPLWNPLLHGGVPFFAEPGTGVLYPPNVVYLLFPAHLAATLFVLLHLPVAAGGAALLARSLGLSRSAGLLAAFGYGTSGYLISMHGGQYYMASAALLPLVVALLVRVADVPTGPRTAAAAVGLGLLGLNGEPQGLVVAAGMGTLLGAIRVRPKGYLALLLSLVLGAMIGAVQLIPSWFFAQWTSRGAALPFTEATYWSMNPVRLVEFLVSAPFGRSHPINTFWAWELVPHVTPRWPWAQTHYLGPVIVGLALLISLKDTSARLKVLAVLVPVSLVIAAGSFTPVFEYWYRYVPLVGRFRYPEKYAVVTALALVVLAAAALDQAALRRRRFIWGFGALAVLLGTVAAILEFHPPQFFLAAIQRGLADPMASGLQVEGCARTAALACAGAAALSAVVAGVHWMGGVRPQVLVPLLVLIAAVDGAANAMASLTYGDAEPLVKPPPTVAGARELFPEESTKRIARALECEQGTFTVWMDRGENVSVSPQEQALLQGWLRAQSNRPQQWGVAETQGYSPMFDPLKDELRSRVRPLQAVQRVEGASALFVCEDGETAVVSFPNPIPRVAVVSGVSSSRAGLFRRLSDLSFDFRSRALVEEYLPPHAGRGQARLLEDQPERVAVGVEGEGGLLVLADSYADGWQADIDGRPARIVRANLLWRGVLVPAGAHTVTFEYRVPGLRLGAWVAAAGGLGVLVLLAWSWFRARGSLTQRATK